MGIYISNFYRHISQNQWGCIKIFHHRNIIIVRRVVFRIELFNVVYLIYGLILWIYWIYVLLCVFKIF